MTLKRIYMNRQIIARNKKEGLFDPAICIRTSQVTRRGHDVRIDGPCSIQQTEEPNLLAGGATVWIQTEAPVYIVTKKENEDEDFFRIA